MSKERLINLDDPQSKGALLRDIRERHGRYRVSIVRFRPRRSDEQNALYWVAYIGPITDHLLAEGFEVTENDVHEHLKKLFLRKSIINLKTGEVLGETVRSTTELTTEEFGDYLTKIEALAAERWGLQLQSNRFQIDHTPQRRVAAAI